MKNEEFMVMLLLSEVNKQQPTTYAETHCYILIYKYKYAHTHKKKSI